MTDPTTPPRALAIPQKNALRGQPHLHESLQAFEQWAQQVSAWGTVLMDAIATLSEQVAATATIQVGGTLYESTTLADGITRTFAFTPPLKTLSLAFINGTVYSDASLVSGAVVFGVGVTPPDVGSKIMALGSV